MSDLRREKFVPGYLKKPQNPHGLLSAAGVLTASVVVSLFYWDTNSPISGLLPVGQSLIFQDKEYWRLLSAIFAHADLDHLLSNSLALGFLTYFVSSYFGFKAVIAGIGLAALTNLAAAWWMDGDTLLVGASGLVYCLWGFWLCLYLQIQKNLKLINRLLRVGAVFLVLLVPTTYSPSTSYFSHYIGFLIGSVAGIGTYWLSPKRPTKEELKEAISLELPARGNEEHNEQDYNWDPEDKEGEDFSTRSP